MDRYPTGQPAALISPRALLHNLKLLRRAVGPGTKICAVVKADAYGHGAGIVIDALCHPLGAAGPAVDALAVASIDEAADLPEARLPLLVFRPVENAFVGSNRQQLEFAIRSGWHLTLCSAAAADDLARIALKCDRRALVHVLIDTGMTRGGASPEQLPALLDAIASRPSLKLAGLYTHFASSELVSDPFTTEQMRRFRAATDRHVRQAGRGGEPPLRHAANSGGVFLAPLSHLDMVRAGISLYGIDPTCRPSLDRPLRPVMKWTAPLIDVREAERGDTVGYGQTWQAERPTKIGLVPVGYADGYLRCLSNRAMMRVHGRPAPVVGRVSMDLTTINLGDMPEARVGDEVIVVDDDPLSPASAYELARLAETIPYEILSRIGPRVQRMALEEDLPDEPA